MNSEYTHSIVYTKSPTDMDLIRRKQYFGKCPLATLSVDPYENISLPYFVL